MKDYYARKLKIRKLQYDALDKIALNTLKEVAEKNIDEAIEELELIKDALDDIREDMEKLEEYIAECEEKEKGEK